VDDDVFLVSTCNPFAAANELAKLVSFSSGMDVIISDNDCDVIEENRRVGWWCLEELLVFAFKYWKALGVKKEGFALTNVVDGGFSESIVDEYGRRMYKTNDIRV
jgi:hypothetical protein